jgi:hypothetical protein
LNSSPFRLLYFFHLYSDPFVDFVLINCYYNLLCLYSEKGKSFILVELEKIASSSKTLAMSHQDAVDQSLSISSLLLRSLTNDSISKSGGDKSQHSRGSRGSSMSGLPVPPPIITTRPRASSRSSPSPIMFNKTGRSSISPSVMINDGGNIGTSSSNPYTNETLQSLLGLARVPSSDQDRNLLGFTTPHMTPRNASVVTPRGTTGSGAFLPQVSLQKNQSLEEIDFTMNTLIEGIYNDILPYSEANVSFVLKCQESVSFASPLGIHVKFVGSLEQVSSFFRLCVLLFRCFL